MRMYITLGIGRHPRVLSQSFPDLSAFYSDLTYEAG
jgi:hypothetical protein